MKSFTVLSQQVQTQRGRAWIYFESHEQNFSFPAIIVIDRKKPDAPQVRIEAIDLFGVTHVLILLNETKQLTSVDFDQKQIYLAQGSWHGLPLSQLPEILLGLAPMVVRARVGNPTADGFDAQFDGGVLRYFISWIDPGPHLALSGLEATIKTPTKAGAAQVESYQVQYSRFIDQGDFELPTEVKITAQSKNSWLKIKVSWRDREWNEKIEPSVFQLSKEGISSFQQKNM